MSGTEYNSVLLSLLGLVATIGAILFWRMFTRMEKKIDEWFSQHLECRERQLKEFVKMDEFEKWQRGRDGIWRRLHGHKHDPEGRVIITSPD
jgi:hypothetical protein